MAWEREMSTLPTLHWCGVYTAVYLTCTLVQYQLLIITVINITCK